MFWKRLALFFIPSPGPLTLAWAAFFITMLLALLMGVVAWSAPGMEGTSYVVPVLVMPPGIVLTGLAALIERRPGARFGLWAAVNGLILLMLALLWIGSALTSPEAWQGFTAILLTCCLPLQLIPALVWAFTAWRAWPAFRRTLRAARLQRLLMMIQARGEATLAEIAADLSLSSAQAAELVCEMIAAHELMAFLDPTHQRVYSAAALAEKQRRLAAAVQTQGKAHIREIAAELHVTEKLVQAWLYALVQRGQLHGFADWPGGCVYARQAEALRQHNRCPHCGGALDMAGKGVIQCLHCGVEVFL
jgi:hypothetical protein